MNSKNLLGMAMISSFIDKKIKIILTVFGKCHYFLNGSTSAENLLKAATLIQLELKFAF